jgi:hypothetical protein
VIRAARWSVSAATTPRTPRSSATRSPRSR